MAVLKMTKSVDPSRRKRKSSDGVEVSETLKKLATVGLKKQKVTHEKKRAVGSKTQKVIDEKKSSAGKGFRNQNIIKEKPLDRKASKERSELRKKKRKPNYDLENEVKLLWEKLRDRKTEKEARAKLASETLNKMKGKLMEMGVSHISSRVLQACVKYCQQSERDSVFEELRPHTLALARSPYAYHLVIKMLDCATKPQLQQMISSLHGKVVPLLRHPVGSAVVEHAYQLANGTQKRELVCEFYSPEYRLFKGITAFNCGFSEFFAKETPMRQNAILQHMMLSLQPILEKGIIDHTITHRVLVEYLSVCKKTMVEDVVKSLAGPFLVRMIHTKDGAKVGVTCVKLSTAKERRKIVQGMKGHILKIAKDEYSNIVLLSILDVVDDTKLLEKVIVKELLEDLKAVASHKYGRRCFLQLLAPGVPRYFSPDILGALQCSTKATLQDSVATPAAEILKTQQDTDEANANTEEANMSDSDNDTTKEVRGISKKDPSVRRFEILSARQLGMKLAEVCSEQANDFLQSPIGTDLIYEVAMGGIHGVLWEVAPVGVRSVHKAISELVALPPLAQSEDKVKLEHVLEQYHSSRTIRRLILNSHAPPAQSGTDSQSFSGMLWDISLKGKCKLWAQGHSAKVISAYKSCGDTRAKEAAESEVQGLVDAGILK